MADTNSVTIGGNLTADPALKILENGTAMATMRVASNDGWFDREAKEWRNTETVFIRVVAWRDLAENLATSARRGDRVIVRGKLRQRTYEPTVGDKRTIVEIEATSIAMDLARATARATKVQREPHTAQEPEFDPVTGEISDAVVVEDLDLADSPIAEPVPF